MTRRPGSGDRGGFALAMVVLLLFAIAVAGATGFQVVSNEFTLATQNRDSQEALIVARAGLQRFLAETVGQVGDSVRYAIGNGIATVTTRKLFEQDSLNHLYYVRSEGSVADARTPLLPATRVVATHAWHRLNPIPLTAAVLLTGGTASIFYSNVDGRDAATTLECPGGGTNGVTGFGTAGTVSVYPGYPGTLVGGTGHPAKDESYTDYNAVYQTVGLRWDILSDPYFPVDFEDQIPDTTTLPADSFPIIRLNGNWMSTGSADSGRGVLIVTGTLTLAYDFTWNGIILAGGLDYATGGGTGYPTVNGMLIAGMNAANPAATFYFGQVNYHSCSVYRANKSLSYLEAVENTMFEVNG